MKIKKLIAILSTGVMLSTACFSVNAADHKYNQYGGHKTTSTIGFLAVLHGADLIQEGQKTYLQETRLANYGQRDQSVRVTEFEQSIVIFNLILGILPV